VTTVEISALGSHPVLVTGLDLTGPHTSDFAVGLTDGTAFPVVLLPGSPRTVAVGFDPSLRGPRLAYLRVRTPGSATSPVAAQYARIEGIGVGPPGAEVRVDAGGRGIAEGLEAEWSADFGWDGGSAVRPPGAFLGAEDQRLFDAQRVGTLFEYALPLVDAGDYLVRLHCAEWVPGPLGARVFDVSAEGQLLVDDLDLAATAGVGVAQVVELEVHVADGELNLVFEASAGQAAVAAIEVRGLSDLAVTPASVDFGPIPTGGSATQALTIASNGVSAASIETLSFLLGPSGTPASFRLELAGETYPGTFGDVNYALDLEIPPGGNLPAVLRYEPQSAVLDAALLRLTGSFGIREVEVQGLGGHAGDPFMHVVIEGPDHFVDYDGDGSVMAALDGSLSHTHEPGHSIVGHVWTLNGNLLSTMPVATAIAPIGLFDIGLTILDDNSPPRTLEEHHIFEVVTSSNVPGVLALYLDGGPGGATQLLDQPSLPAPDYAEVLPGLALGGTATVGASPFAQNVLVRLVANLQIATAGTYELVALGGADRRLTLDGTPVTGPRLLPVGSHALEARFAVSVLAELPLEVRMGLAGEEPAPVAGELLRHDQSGIQPVIDDMPESGATSGGNPIDIHGLGFFPAGSVVVNWGSTELDSSDFTIEEADHLRFLSPPAPTGSIAVTVETPNGVSNARTFFYDPQGPVPIVFVEATPAPVPQPTVGAWGPDGRFYTSGRHGQLTATQFGDSYQVVSTQSYPGVSSLPNREVLGIAFSPFDGTSPVRVYLAHGQLFVNGGTSFSGPSPYTGQVSVLEGPSFDNPVPLITGLPVSNHDHGINGMVFDHNGDLLIAVGGVTNAGIEYPTIGDIPESPLSGAILKAYTSKPGFDGTVVYLHSQTGLPDADQVHGDEVDVAPGVDVVPWATGIRNAFDLVLSTWGFVYATDNGPNFGFGPASTGPGTQGPDPFEIDEVLLVEPGLYYGHPNLSRARYDPREYVYRNLSGPSIPGEFAQAISGIPSSSNGIDEYRSDVFGGAMRGDLFVQRWISQIRRVRLSENKRNVLSISLIEPWTGALGLRMGPGGALLATDYGNNRVRILLPSDPSASGLQVHDVTPWRAPATGGRPFVIAGIGFGTLANTSVRIGGVPAALTSVSPTRIRGIVPPKSPVPIGLVDVQVTVGPNTDVHEDAFQWLHPVGQAPGTWETLASLPVSLGEVAAGRIGGVLYVVGEGSNATLAFDLASRAFLPNAASRPFVGHHHGAEVVGGKLYLIGGLGGGSEGKVQIYDPVANSWSTGAQMPWSGGSVSTAAIAGKIYAAGGIVGSVTVSNCAVYDPVPNTWTVRAAMPQGRNHAASATDGARMFVFGGRDGGNFVANGFAEVQIYDPVANTWQSSSNPGSTLAPLPIGRGGMGKAVYWFGEFYVFGGETATGPGAVAGNVYNRVDVYDPEANTWRLDAPMPVPRHGVFPVLYQGRMYLPGGGTHSGFSSSTAFDALYRP
jgi:N-acetylneuraminic acid mutarotase/glucose/arabinose dehydrogenase